MNCSSELTITSTAQLLFCLTWVFYNLKTYALHYSEDNGSSEIPSLSVAVSITNKTKLCRLKYFGQQT